MAKKKPASTETASTYITKGRVRHDGDRYAIGDEIDLTPSQAAELLAAGIIVPAAATSAATGSAAAPIQLSAATLGKMNLGELTGYAEAHNVKLDADLTKDQIIEAINAAISAA